MVRLKIYRLLYKVTRNRKWLIRYIDEMNYQTMSEIKEFRNAVHGIRN